MHKRTARFSAAAMLLVFSSAAYAHPGHNVSGFTAGLMHPFLGLDHLLAMAAVGLWAAQSGGKRIWLLPAAFMTMLVMGAALAMQWPSLQLVESGTAFSVLALGLLIALAWKLPASLSVAITALFGLLHGYAHGLELPESAAPAEYAFGFLGATASLHLGGMAVGVASRSQYAALTRILGVAVAACGAYLLANS
jgi:urease accessory protein